MAYVWVIMMFPIPMKVINRKSRVLILNFQIQIYKFSLISINGKMVLDKITLWQLDFEVKDHQK